MAAAGSSCRDLAITGGGDDGCRVVVAILVMVAVAAEVNVRTALMLVPRQVAGSVVEMRHRGCLEQQVSHKTQERR